MGNSFDGVIQITNVNYEKDPDYYGKNWLWLKINSSNNCPVEIFLVSKKGYGHCLTDPNRKSRHRVSLGYHYIRKGLNELPPLPFWVDGEDKSKITVSIIIQSIHDALQRHHVSLDIFPPPPPIIDPKSIYLFEFP